jgi:hypothetical protein
VVSVRKTKPKLSGRERFLVSALLALAIFFIEAGSAEVILARNAQCEALADNTRMGFRVQNMCLPEWLVQMFEAASHGVMGIFRPEASPFTAWLFMGGLYALVGGICGQLSIRWGIVIFLALNVAVISLLAGLDYMSQFIVFSSSFSP